MKNYRQLKSILRKSVTNPPASAARFFKTGKGDYAENDQFIGINVPTLRKIAREFATLSFSDLKLLLQSPINEERLLSLFILTKRYKNADTKEKNKIYQFYINNLKYVNNWNLVDSSAHLIVGAHLFEANKKSLLSLSKSNFLWKRRVAIVATWHFIQKNQFEWTLKISEILLKDPHDLIHKAVGWMLREVGKRDTRALIVFLDQYAAYMPRTMLRYAIEKFPLNKRKNYLAKRA